MPDRRVWSGESSMVIAKTLEGDIGIMTSHPPVIGVLAAGSLVRILDPQAAGQMIGGGERGVPGVAVTSGGPGGAGAQRPGGVHDSGGTVHTAPGSGTESPVGSDPGETAGKEVAVAVGGGFLSVADDRVSILATEAVLGSDVDTAEARADLEAALASAGTAQPGD